MRLVWLELAGVRTYDRLRFEPDAGTNVLVGANAVGKTNLIEAIGYLATLGSFRRAPDEAIVAQGAEAAIIRGEVDHGDRRSLIEVEIPREGRRRAQVNRSRLARSADLADHLRAVVFQPDDLDIAKRSPSHRRDFLDDAAALLWPAAAADRSDYERAVRHRNALLRQMGRRADPTTLEVWNQRVSVAGAGVLARRRDTVAALSGRVETAYSQLAGTEVAVDLHYRSDWVPDLDGTPEEWTARLWAALEAAAETDMDRRVTTVGPHRDDPAWTIDGRDARLRASQGEQRTLVLSLRLAQQAAVRHVAGVSPVLLLDDVFSELDTDRASALAGALPGGQSFITTARDEEVPLSGRRWRVTSGAVT
ncbi:MAG: DNA replication/repair protein RecF [Acidimicrobiia bacterium]